MASFRTSSGRASFRTSSGRVADEDENAITSGVPEMNKASAVDPVGIPYAPTGGPAAAAAAAAVETMESEKESQAKSKESGAKAKPAGAVSYFSLYKYADRLDYFYMFFGTIGGICDGLLMPISVIIVIQLVNAFNRIHIDPESERRIAKKYITGMMIYAPCIGLASFLEPACWMRTGERQALRIRAMYLRAVLRQNEGFFDTRGASATEVVSGIAADTTAIQEAISEKVGTFISFMTAFFCGLGIALYFSWKLGLIWVAAAPLLISPGIIYGKRLGSTAGAMGFASRQAGNVAGQALSSIHTVYSYVGENKVLKTYSENLQVVLAHGVRMGLFKSLAIGTTGLAYAVWALVLWVGSRMVINDGLKGTSVLNTGFIAVNGIQAVGYAFGLMKFFKDGCKAAHRVFEVIDRVPEIDPWDEKGKVLKKIDGNLELQNVHFVYPARPNSIIFSDFSLSIHAGTKIALVGGSGSGKSTVIALLERFYDPVKGRVLLDGIDIRELRLKWLRTQIGLVSQEPALFATTIGENIMMGQEDASIEEMVEAAKRSNAHKFIEEFPDGYKTQVGERGVKMSGGQKQRIAIARAILKKPAVLLLDEATSALDAESERVVQDALDSVSTGRTTVIVAHRLSTIKDASTIAVLKEGRIVEMGSHDELTVKDGAYASLVRLQQARADEKATGDGTEAIPYKRSSSINISGRASSLRKSLQIVGERPSSFGNADGDGEADEIIVKKPSPPSFRKLLAMNRPEWKQGVLGSIGACGFGTMYPLYSFLISSLMSGLYNPDPHHITVQVRKFCLIFVAMSIGAVTFSLMQHYNFAIMGESLTRRVRERLLSKFLTFEVGWYDDEQNSSGILSARLATEAAVVRALVSDRLSLLIQTSAAIIFSASVSLALSYKLALVMIALQPLAIFSYAGKGQVLRHMYMASIKAQEDASQVASEAVSHHRTVTAFGVEEKIAGIFDNLQSSPRKVRMAQLRALVAGLGLGFANFAIVFLFAFSLWWANRLLQRGEISVSALFKVFFIVIATGRMIGETGSVATDIARSATSIIKIFDILDRRTLIDAEIEDAKKIDKVDGSVELRNVEFYYPTRPDIQVFKNLNLKVRAGRSMALVGRSGSGKSSVVALIERFYDPVKGVVYIDDRDIRTLRLKSLRMHIALVSQEPVLFAGTLRENIQYGRESASEAEIIEAAKSANAYNFICGLKDGFDTKAGDRGVQMSGGQKQRIAIARAIVKNPSILLLDEATSALDAESERIVQDALDKVMVGRTSIIVAHRLSTIKDCDCISVIKDGAVCEQGRHNELISKGGAYSELVKLQSGEEM